MQSTKIYFCYFHLDQLYLKTVSLLKTLETASLKIVSDNFMFLVKRDFIDVQKSFSMLLHLIRAYTVYNIEISENT